MSGYTDVFGGSTVQPSDVQFAEVTLTASITTDWPEYATTTQPVARIMQVDATVAALTITLPDARLVSQGQDILFDGTGANTFTVLDNAGGVIATVAAGAVRYLYLSDNSTAAGTWRSTLFGAGSSALDASQLAGYGLKAITNTLNAAPLVSGFSSDLTVVSADRAKVFVWTGASGTLTLPTTAGSTSDFLVEVRNQGSGTLTIAPVGGVLIDSSANITLSVNESCFVHMGATAWYTVGRGRNTNFNFTQLSKAVTGGTTALTLTEASNVVQTYTGALVSNQTITLPAVVQVYYVRNNTSGAFTFTFACAGGGSTVAVASLQAAVLFCDGTNIINANTSLGGGISALLFAAGSVTTPSIGLGTAPNGFYAPATNEVGVAVNGVYVGKWTTTGFISVNAISGPGTGLTGTAAGLTAGSVSTNANLTGPITSVGNATSVASQTGTGSTFVMNNGPTLVAPVLGVATGTSFNGITGLSATTPVAAGVAAVGVGTASARDDHVHPGQTITLTGGVTGSGTGSFVATVVTNANLTGVVTSVGNATSIAAGAISNTMLANSAVATLSGTNTGDNATNTQYASDYRSANFVAGTNYVAPGGALGTPSSGNVSNCTADGTNPVGFRNIPQNSQSAAYTLVLADAGKHILHPSADTTARIFTIPANSSVAFPVGTAVTFVNQNAGGVITIAITTDTMRLAGAGTTGSRTLAANGVATAVKLTTTEWIISGTSLT